MVVVVHQCKQATPLSGAAWHPSINNTTAASPTFMICGQKWQRRAPDCDPSLRVGPIVTRLNLPRPTLLFSPDENTRRSVWLSELKTSRTVWEHYTRTRKGREGKGRGHHGKAAYSDTLKTRMLFRLLFNLRRKKKPSYLLPQLWIWTVSRWLRRLEEFSIIIGLVNPWPIPLPTPIEDEPSYTDGLKDN